MQRVRYRLEDASFRTVVIIHKDSHYWADNPHAIVLFFILSYVGVRILERLIETSEWQSAIQRMMIPNCPNQKAVNDVHDSSRHWKFDELPKDHQTLCTDYEYGTDEFWM